MKALGYLPGLAASLVVAAAPAGAAERKAPADGTLGFVLASYSYDFDKAEEKIACPAGFVLSNEEQWQVQFPTDAARRAQLSRCLLEANRGPNCENVWNRPDVVKDPVAYRSVRSPVGIGANLDGTQDGRATSRTCKHEKFTSPDGRTRVDNQYFRLLGCDKFMRSDVYSDNAAKGRAKDYLINRIVIEVTGVDDLKNDKSVGVTLYRGMDPLAVNASGDALPWQSQRIDPAIPPVRLKGRIVDGTLITEPKSVFFEGLFHERRMLVHDMSLRLKLSGDRAEGLRVGYVDVPRLWESYSRAARWGGQTYGASPPSMHRAMFALADGVKDPKTGRCTGLSSARGYKFVRAYLIHSKRGRRP
jgi:hypothetical protein